ncbi:MAG: hypothetical protein HKN47_17175 [Pirellulaceae bacterium]|nr:hypothetical protein [Pirellulaceae bacterium]
MVDSSDIAPASHKHSRSALPILLALVAATLAGVVTFFASSLYRPDSAPAVPAAALPSIEPVEAPIARDVQRAIFFDNEVEPRIAEADRLNREAADRCVRRITMMMDRYRCGVDPFVNDLTSMSTRFGIVKRMPGDWWRKDNRIESYVEEKFEFHLFSEQTLMNDITQVLDDFKSEIDANQKRMLISVKTALGEADLPEVQADEYQPFFESVAQQLQHYSAKQGTASVQNAVGVFVISEAGVFAGRTIVVGLLARFGSTAVIGTAAGATATAGTTATGTGVGAFGGPAGAVVGFGIGLAVGFAIDWWMTEKFEARLSEQMNQYLDTLESTLLHGGATRPPAARTAGGSDNQNSGLVDALPVVCDHLLQAYRESFYEQIVTGVPTS